MEFDNLKVLLAEDNAINAMVMRKTLERMGVSISVANNGQEAIDLLQVESFDLILMDLYMPIMDGFEATKQIRSLNEPHCKTPIIALTAAFSEDIEQETKAVGMNDYLPKPFKPEDLVEKLKQLTA